MQDLDEILELIKDGKISIRQASEQSGYGRDFLKSSLIKKYGKTVENLQEIQQVMDNNKINSATKQLNEEILESIFLKVVNGEITLEAAQEELGGIDRETLRNKFWDLVKNSHSAELVKKYREYQIQKQDTDHSNINFRAVAIYMIRNRLNQTQIAQEMFLSPRTISREFEKLKEDEDMTLYEVIKFYSDKVMRGQKFTRFEEVAMMLSINTYEQKHPELLEENLKSKTEEKAEKMIFLVSEEKRLREEGFTQAEIAQKLGTSISGLRRARIFVEQQNIVNNDTMTGVENETDEDSSKKVEDNSEEKELSFPKEDDERE